MIASHLIAVASTKYVTGIDRISEGRPLDKKGAPIPGADIEGFAACGVAEALTRVYPTDAHLVAYILRGREGSVAQTQPRINKRSLPDFRQGGYHLTINTFLADLDRPEHARWVSIDQALTCMWRVIERVGTCGCYISSSGIRVVQPLTIDLDVEDAELRIETWLHELKAKLAGIEIEVDTSCADWTRHFRLPHVVRDGKPFQSPAVELRYAAQVDPPAPTVRIEPPKMIRSDAPPTERQSKAAVKKLKGCVKLLTDYVGPNGAYLSGGNTKVLEKGRYLGGLVASGCLDYNTVFNELSNAIVNWGESIHDHIDTLERAIENGMRAPLMPDDPPPDLAGLLCTPEGKVLSGLANSATIFATELHEKIGWDERRCRAEWTGLRPWDDDETRTVAWEEGRDDVEAVQWLAASRFKTNEQAHVAGKAVMAIARRKPFDRFRNYLSALVWDGVPRIDGIARQVLGAQNAISDKMISKTMIAACARTFRPGSKVDTMTILKGHRQGSKKSSFWEYLVPAGFYAKAGENMFDRDGLMSYMFAAIADVEELDAMRGREVTKVKGFLSQHTDTFRAPYAANVTEHPRRFIFVGTTNKDDFLEDTTGNRRFWIIDTHGKKIDMNLVQMLRDLWWAEAVYRFRAGEQWWLIDDDELAAEEVAEVHRAGDPWETMIEGALLRGASPTGMSAAVAAQGGKVAAVIAPNCKCVTTEQIFDLVVNVSRENRTKIQEHRVVRILQKLSFRPYRMIVEGQRRRVYVKDNEARD